MTSCKRKKVENEWMKEEFARGGFSLFVCVLEDAVG